MKKLSIGKKVKVYDRTMGKLDGVIKSLHGNIAKVKVKGIKKLLHLDIMQIR